MSSIAVVIPAYNAEKYLPQCLNSILKQTFKDFCVVIVDDGSKDRTPQICDEYAAKDNRVHVIHQKKTRALLRPEKTVF